MATSTIAMTKPRNINSQEHENKWAKKLDPRNPRNYTESQTHRISNYQKQETQKIEKLTTTEESAERRDEKRTADDRNRKIRIQGFELSRNLSN